MCLSGGGPTKWVGFLVGFPLAPQTRALKKGRATQIQLLTSERTLQVPHPAAVVELAPAEAQPSAWHLSNVSFLLIGGLEPGVLWFRKSKPHLPFTGSRGVNPNPNQSKPPMRGKLIMGGWEQCSLEARARLAFTRTTWIETQQPKSLDWWLSSGSSRILLSHLTRDLSPPEVKMRRLSGTIESN